MPLVVEHLFINVEHHGATRWLLAAIETYHQAWPNVAVDVPMASVLDPLPALAQGDLDVVFTTAPIEDPALIYEPCSPSGCRSRWHPVTVPSRSA